MEQPRSVGRSRHEESVPTSTQLSQHYETQNGTQSWKEYEVNTVASDDSLYTEAYADPNYYELHDVSYEYHYTALAG